MKRLINAAILLVGAVVSFAVALLAGVAVHHFGADDIQTGIAMGIVVVGFWPALGWLIAKSEAA